MNQLTSASSLLDLPALRAHLGSLNDWLDDATLSQLLGRIFLRNLRIDQAATGDAQSWSFQIVLPQALELDLPVPGLRIAVNPRSTPGAPTVLDASASYQLPILAFTADFDADAIGHSARGAYNFLREASRASAGELIAATMRALIDDQDPLQAFLTDYAARHGALNVTLVDDILADASAVAHAMTSAGIDPFEYVFQHYVDAPELLDAQAILSLLFQDWYDFTPADLERLTAPVIEAAFHDLEIVLSLPRWLLVPIKTPKHTAAAIEPGVDEGEPLAAPHQARATATIATLGFSSELGFSMGPGVVFALDAAEIGHTRLRLAVDGLSFDLSPSKTPRLLRQAGFSPAFVGFHAHGARLAWLPELIVAGQRGIGIDLRDLAIGSEGLLAVAEQSWGIDEADPLGPGSELVARIAAGWRVGLAEASGSLAYRRIETGDETQEDWRATLGVSGLLELPFWNVLLGLRFSLELTGDLARTRMQVELRSTPLAVNLGDAAQLRFDMLGASGMLASDGSFALQGTARGEIGFAVGSLSILQGTFDIPTLSLAYAAHAELVLEGTFNAVLFADTRFSADLTNLHTNLRLEADDSGVSRFALDLTGFGTELQLTDAIRVTIEDCVLDLNVASSPQAITDLGFDATFIGLLAQRGELRWSIPGSPDPLAIELGMVAAGSGGAAMRQQWSESPLTFSLFRIMTLALTEVDGLLLLDGTPAGRLDVRGTLDLPGIGAGFEGRLHLQQGTFGDQVRLQIHGSGLSIDLGGAGAIEIESLEIDGALTDAGFSLFGQVTEATLTLTGFDGPVQVAGSVVRFETSGADTLLRLALNGLELGLDSAPGLSFGSDLTLTLHDGALTGILLSGETSWDALDIPTLPEFFPQPPADATLGAELRWSSSGWELGFRAAIDDAEPMLARFPAAFRPDLRNLELELNGAHQSTGGGFSGTVAIALELRLPTLNDLPGADLVSVQTGSPDGWMRARISADTGPTSTGMASRFALTLSDLVTVDVDLPGLPQTEPVIHTELTETRLEFSDASGVGGMLEVTGAFDLRPITPQDLGVASPPIVDKLSSMLGNPEVFDLAGVATHTIRFDDNGIQIDLDCRFKDAGLDIDLFDLLVGAVGGNSVAVGADASEIDLDLEIGFRLQRIALTLGSLDAARGGQFSFELEALLEMAGLSAEVSIELTDTRFAFGLERLAIPIALPRLPMNRDHLDALRDTNGRWDPDIWNAIEGNIDTALSVDQSDLDQARAELEQLEANAAADDADHAGRIYELRYRTIPDLQKTIFHHVGNKFLTGAIMAVHDVLGALSTSESQASYQGMVELYQDAIDATVGSLHFDTRLQFEIVDARFVLPFDDPANIRVEGGASLKGFAPDDPLRPLQDLVFKLGLSADAIFFSVEGGAEPIPLPDFGRYPGNAIVFDRLVIGYGYNKNSLLVDFSGKLELSPDLIEDVDTSSRLGVGVRLPSNSRLKFKIDLIPIVLGEVDFLLPLIAFDIDLRSANPPVAPVSEVCAPAWDGLQFHAPGILRADIKRAKVSPFFGPFPAPNYLYGFDIDIGNEQLGFTQICDNYQAIIGAVTVPLLADGTPFFDHYCTNLRIAGFGINFDLRRPFPHPSPLMIFELLGFLSDPSLPIDPAGHLADVVWAELRNARITLPPVVLGMFPEHGRAITREHDIRINLGTVITLAQQLVGVVDMLQARLAQHAGDMDDMIEQLTQNPPKIAIDDLLDLLPRELRRVELNGGFVGFSASAVFLLVSPGQFRSHLFPTPPGQPPSDSTGAPWVDVVHDDFSAGTLSGWRPFDHGLKAGETGNWSIDQGTLIQRNNVGDNSPGRYGAALIRETDPLSDVRITVSMSSSDNDGIGVLFHVQGETSYYRFRMTSEQNQWHLMRLKKGVTQVLHATATAFSIDKIYRIRIEARSVRQDGPALPGGFDRRTRPSSRRPGIHKPAYTTHIRIWVDNALWCDLVDSDRPLTAGQIGLDSWWNKGARFHELRIERAERVAANALELDRLALARDLVPLASNRGGPTPQTAETAAWTADDLADFDDDDLLLAIPETTTAAVVVTARVRLLGTQTYRFIGIMQADGHFRLLSSTRIEPIALSVAGIDVVFPLTIVGRLALDGRSAGADSWARFQAQLYGDWDILPAPGGSLARIIVASEDQPASITADSRGRFQLQGDGELCLFGDQVRLGGSLDISERHAFVRGTMDLESPVKISADTPVLSTSLQAEGRIGPGRDFRLAGTGSLVVLGRAFSDVSAELSPDGLALAGRLAADSDNWEIKGFALTDVQMALHGRIGFRRSVPDIRLEGDGHLGIADATVDGQIRITANDTGWSLGATGALGWQGQNWLEGAVELCDDRLTVRGQARFAIQLTGNQLPGNIQIAGLFLTATIDGSFNVRSSGRLSGCRFNLSWTLSVQLPGSESHPQQALPIASQRLDVDVPNLPTNSSNQPLVDIINLNGLTLLPLEGISIPIPTLSETNSQDLYLHTQIIIDPESFDLPFSLVTIDPGPSDDPNDPILGFPLYTFTPSIDPPSFNLPMFFLSDRPPAGQPGQQPLLSIPAIDTADIPITGGVQLADLVLGLQLRWKDGKLGVWVVQTQQFHPFDGVTALLPIGIIGTFTGPSQ